MGLFRWLSRVWRVLDYRLWRIRRGFSRRRRELEAQAIELGRELWDMVDDFPLIGDRARIAPVHNQFYGHGSFMGAAPALLDDAHWRRILAFLMPDVFRDVQRALTAGAKSGRIIPMFENNPVMAAYGTWRSVQLRNASDTEPGQHDLSGHEWDVFVDSNLVVAWESAGPDDALRIIAKVVDTMLIAHATSTDTAQEHFGLFQYPDVRRTRKSAMGGVEAPAWLDLFARALALAESEDLAASIRQMSADPRRLGVEECQELTFETPWPISEAVTRSATLTGRPHLSVVLEIKSLRSTPALLIAVVEELNRRGVHVSAVGSFLRDEIAGVAEHEQTVAGEVLPGPREILFFHTEGDLQAACDAGSLPPGQHALFNGAGLLEPDGMGYRVDEPLLGELEAYRQRHELRLGFYVQESDCDAEAAALLSELSASYPETFELGFAWGGLQDEAALMWEQTADRRGYGAQALLIKLGTARRWRYTGR